ncbi:hypothetical protein [Proteiniphilum sp. UBA5510]|uniref:hypothetical protein n=1 Tax=Proteiniphilum sp. UBA5510 TaxID=1947286 RepID=UPI00257B6C5F|nr:hypothetical protein [Proteiniphilum sp. UBA5510]
MKKIVLSIFAIIFFGVSCSDDNFTVDYTPEVVIQFKGVDESNIHTVDKGVMSYTTTIGVRTSNEAKISSFEIYDANAETGAAGTLIEEESKFFEDGVTNYEKEYTIDNLTENKCIKIIVTDISGNVFEKNLLVKITPSVIFSKPVNIETVENYYGPYFASWYSGRVYMRKDGKYKDEIDFSLGDIVDDASQTIIPSFVNPSKRQDYKLLTMSGLQSAKFELTDLTKDQYMNITQVNAELINSLPDPQKDVIKIEKDKIYLFKTANGKKGLIHPSSLTKTSGTIEDVNEKWIENTSYHQITLSTKTIMTN